MRKNYLGDITQEQFEQIHSVTLKKMLNRLLAENSSSKNKTIAYRYSFEVFKSNVCHYVKDLGDLNFIIKVIESGEIRHLYEKEWYREAFYQKAYKNTPASTGWG